MNLAQQLGLFTETRQTDAELGRAGMRAGMAIAKAHAEDVEPGWHQRAYEYLLAVVAKGGDVIAPDVRRSYPGPAAPTAFAWGAVFARAAREGKIVKAGMSTYGDLTMHQQNVQVWKAAP